MAGGRSSWRALPVVVLARRTACGTFSLSQRRSKEHVVESLRLVYNGRCCLSYLYKRVLFMTMTCTHTLDLHTRFIAGFFGSLAPAPPPPTHHAVPPHSRVGLARHRLSRRGFLLKVLPTWTTQRSSLRGRKTCRRPASQSTNCRARFRSRPPPCPSVSTKSFP